MTLNTTPHQAMGTVIAQIVAIHAHDFTTASALVNSMTRDELIGAVTVAVGWITGLLVLKLRTAEEGCRPFHAYIEKLAADNAAAAEAEATRAAD